MQSLSRFPQMENMRDEYLLCGIEKGILIKQCYIIILINIPVTITCADLDTLYRSPSLVLTLQ